MKLAWSALGLTTVLLCLVAPARTSTPARVALTTQILAVGDGTRILSSRRTVLDAGMSIGLREEVGRRGPDGLLLNLCHLRIQTAERQDQRLDMIVDSLVQQGAGDQARQWKRQGKVSLRPGTSSMLELAPAEAAGEKLLLALTLEPAAGEIVNVEPTRVEIQIGVIGVDGEESVLLQRPSLRTLTGQPAEFSFDYPVPRAQEDGFDHVRFHLTVSPGFPQGERIPLRLQLEGEYPTLDGPVLMNRDESVHLGQGEMWTVEIRPPSGEGAGFRIVLAALWEQPAFDFDEAATLPL